MYTLHSSCVKNIETLRQSNNPLSEWLILAVLLFIKKSPIDFGVLNNGGFRTSEEQNKIFLDNPHNTKCDGFIKKSKHQSGLAIDLVPWVNNSYTWDEIHTTGLSMAFKLFCNNMGLDVVSGADWDGNGNLNEKFYDPCHFEIRGLL